MHVGGAGGAPPLPHALKSSDHARSFEGPDIGLVAQAIATGCLGRGREGLHDRTWGIERSHGP